jgi:hypothetical protein
MSPVTFEKKISRSSYWRNWIHCNSRCRPQLLKAGYSVIGTARSQAKAEPLQALFAKYGAD